MSFTNNQSEGVPLFNNNENSSLPIVQSRTQSLDPNVSENLQHMSAERIIVDVKRIIAKTSTPEWERVRRQQNWPKFHEELEEEFRDFKISYPALFRMAIESGRNFDMNQLLQFLQLREQMMSGNVNESEAHKHVGQSMVDKYVIPHLPNRNDSN
jgi:hypothetical protein